MTDEIPDGCGRYVLSENERFPTLDVDDCSWRGDPMGTEPPGFYPDERTLILPTAVVEIWKSATESLRAIERVILEIEQAQRKLQPEVRT